MLMNSRDVMTLVLEELLAEAPADSQFRGARALPCIPQELHRTHTGWRVSWSPAEGRCAGVRPVSVPPTRSRWCRWQAVLALALQGVAL